MKSILHKSSWKMSDYFQDFYTKEVKSPILALVEDYFLFSDLPPGMIYVFGKNHLNGTY